MTDGLANEGITGKDYIKEKMMEIINPNDAEKV